jgi:hypothetical protein
MRIWWRRPAGGFELCEDEKTAGKTPAPQKARIQALQCTGSDRIETENLDNGL